MKTFGLNSVLNKPFVEFNIPRVLLIYFIISLVMTFPLMLNFSSSIIGNDPYGEVWSYWLLKKAIFEWHRFPSPYIEHKLAHYPSGQGLYVLDSLNALVSIPFQFIFGLSASYNIVMILNLILGCFSAYLLIRYLTNNTAAGFVSGIIYGCSPYLLSALKIGWSEAVNIGWIPLYVLFLHKLLRENKKKNIVITALLYFLVTFSNWYYGMCISIFTIFFLLFHSFSLDQGCPDLTQKRRLRFNKQFVSRGILVGLLFFLMIVPFAYLFQKSLVSAGSTGKQSHFFLLIGESRVDIFSYFQPGKFYSFQYIPDASVYLVYVGYFVLLLVLVGLSFKKKEDIFWLVTFFFFFLLSLGPYLCVGGKYLLLGGEVIKMPYLFMYKYVPFFYQIKVPHRFCVIVMLCLSVLAGRGLCGILSVIKEKNKQRITFLIAILILLEFLFFSPAEYPIPAVSATIPEYCYILADEKEDFAIVDVPVPHERLRSLYFYFQTVHQKSILFGQHFVWLSELFENNDFLRYFKEVSLTKTGITFVRHFMHPDNTTAREALEELESIRVKYIVVHNDLIRDQEEAAETHRFLNYFLGAPYYSEDNATIYKIY